MSTFGSSVINKSNKKFAPKAPQQRRRPAAAPTAPPTSQTQDAVAGQEESTPNNSAQNKDSGVPTITHRREASHDLDTPVSQEQRRSTPNPSNLVEEDSRPTKRRRVDDVSTDAAAADKTAVESATSPQATASSLTEIPSVSFHQEDATAPNIATSEENITLSSTAETSNSASNLALESRAEPTTIERQEPITKEVGASPVSSLPDTGQVEGHVNQEPNAPVEHADTRQAPPKSPNQVANDLDGEPTDGLAPELTVESVEQPVEINLRQMLDQHANAPAAAESSDHTLDASAATIQMDQESHSHARIGQAPVAVMGTPGKKSRKPRKKANQATNAGDEGQNDSAALVPTAKKPRKSRQKAAVQPLTDSALTNDQANASTPAPPNTGEGEELADGTPSEETESRQRGRKRAVTPEGAEDIEIDPETVTMFDLCKDTRQGKKSQRESEFQSIDWTEVAKRRKQAEARARAGLVDEEKEERERQEQEADRPRAGPRGPQLKIVNGRAVLDADSLIVTRNAGPGEGDEVAMEESDLTKRINSHSWIYDNRRDPEERYRSSAKSDPWSEEQTDQFYDALRMFGTDFFIISKMFPGKTRRHIKLKFNREERGDPTRVKLALIGGSVPMDLDVYCAATGQEVGEFKDPEALEEELRAQDEAQKLEIEQQKEEHAEAARKKQEAAKARADGKKGKKGQGKRGKKGAMDAGGEDMEVGANDE